MQYVCRSAEAEFQRNLVDWCLGGPKPGGWTRTGPAVPKPCLSLGRYNFCVMPAAEVLAKNRAETARWHLAFLAGDRSAYVEEYLNPRGMAAGRFLALFESVRACGVLRPVMVADVSGLGFGFDYFRFNGCHRTCCAVSLGLAGVPACVFRAVS